MRKALLAILCLVLSVCLLTACGNGVSESQNTNEPTGGAEYRPPAEFINIDLTADDPSDNQISFKYDDEGRVSECYYMVGDLEIYLSYSYEGKSIHIFGFSDGVVVADETFQAITDFNPDVKFEKYNGYYFNGFTF